MSVFLYLLLACGLTLSVSLFLGNGFLRGTNAELGRSEAKFLAFVIGSGLLAATVLPFAALGLARRGNFLVLGLALLAILIWRGAHRFPAAEPSRLPVPWRFIFRGAYALFGLWYACAAVAPPAESGTFFSDTVQLGRTFGFQEAGGIPNPSGSLALFAFVIGRHSAVSVTSFLFLLALPIGIRAFSERIGHARAGAAAGLCYFMSPAVARAGTAPAPDLQIAATAFALFCTLHSKLYPAAAVLAGLLVWNVMPLVHADTTVDWLDLTLLGDPVSGLLGLGYVLSPLALLSLRSRDGRLLLLAALVCSLPFALAPGARTLIPALPFISLALAISLSDWNYALPALLTAHAIFSWPPVVQLYSSEYAWQLGEFDWRAALRLEPEDRYLMRTFPTYYTGRFLERTIPDGAKVLALSPFQQIYHTRELVQDARLRELVLNGSPVTSVQLDDIHWVLARLEDPRTASLLDHADERGLDVRFMQEGWALFETR